MTYEQAVNYLYESAPLFQNIGAGAYKEGLSNTQLLDEHFHHPHRHYATIHVAGTNGKGSVSHTLAAILQSQGMKVGLYTSPHLTDFRERIRVNGQMMPKQRVVDFVEQERSFFEPLHPSFFELTTALAFKFFEEQGVDIAVIEVGLGGRLDCTNIIQPLVSIITNISFDHIQFLGNTLEKIAGEKAGIIKHGVPVVVGETTPETRPVFEQKARLMQAPILLAEDAPEVTAAHMLPEGGISYDTRSFGTLKGELGGTYQQKNANTVLTAVGELMRQGIIRHGEAVAEGFAHVCEATGLEGRWQQLQTAPRVVCDTGHNVGGWQYLSRQIAAQPCKQLRIVFGMVDDKDIDTVMQLLPGNAVYHFTQASTHRAIPVDRVMEKARQHGLEGTPHSTVEEAYRQALAEADTDDFIFVGGSSYVVADLLTALQH